MREKKITLYQVQNILHNNPEMQIIAVHKFSSSSQSGRSPSQADSSAFCGGAQTVGFILTSLQQSCIRIANICGVSWSQWTACGHREHSYVTMHCNGDERNPLMVCSVELGLWFHILHIYFWKENLQRILLLPLTGFWKNATINWRPLIFLAKLKAARSANVCIEHPLSLHHWTISA